MTTILTAPKATAPIGPTLSTCPHGESTTRFCTQCWTLDGPFRDRMADIAAKLLGEIYTVMTCVRDENGNLEGRLTGLTIGDDFGLEPAWWEFRRFPAYRYDGERCVVISRRRFRIRGYGTHVGNICNDALHMEGFDLIAMMLYLQRLGKFTGWRDDENWETHGVDYLAALAARHSR